MICYKMNIPIEELINRVREQESDIEIKRINPFTCNTNAMVYFQCKCGSEAKKTVKKILKSHAMCVTCSEVYYGNKKREDNKIKYSTENPTPLEVSNLKLMKKQRFNRKTNNLETKRINTNHCFERIAVFIDSDNIPYNSITIIIAEIRKRGRIILQNAYGDWSYSSSDSWNLISKELGIILIQCDRIIKKNSTDIKLCIDVIKSLYANESITSYYIISSDSDYRHLFPEIKQKDKRVYCIGSMNTNYSVKATCDEFIEIEKISSRKEISDVSRTKIVKEINHVLKANDLCTPVKKVEDHLKTAFQFDCRDFGYWNMETFISTTYSHIFVDDQNMVRFQN